jgi:hypothetical protein
VAVVALLVGANVVLLVLLLRPELGTTAEPAGGASDGNSLSATSAPGATTSSEGSEHTSWPNSSDSSDATPSSQPIDPAPAERLLVVVSPNTAWRATAGRCDAPGTVERSTDGGITWKRVVRADLAPIVVLSAGPGGNPFAIGGKPQSCSARFIAYDDDGTVAASIDPPKGVWFPTPSNPDQINGPGDSKAAPCDEHVVGLAPLDMSRALVVCSDGAAMITNNSGSRWRQAARLPRTLAITAGAGRYWLARTDKHCSDAGMVQSLTPRSGNLTLGASRCAPATNRKGGQVAIGVSGDAIWLWSDKKVHLSRDNGRTWD